MAATLASALPVGPHWSYEVKWDGYRALLAEKRHADQARLAQFEGPDRGLPAHRRRRGSLPVSVLLDGEIVAQTLDAAAKVSVPHG